MAPLVYVCVRPQQAAAEAEYASFRTAMGLDESGLERVDLTRDPLPDDALCDQLTFAHQAARRLANVDDWDHPDARRIRPGWRGEPFSVHDCVQALITMKISDPEPQDDLLAA